MEIDKDHLHHAYILVGEWEGATDTILQALSISKDNNPDLFIYEVLGIDEARHIKARAQASAFGEKKIFVINAVDVTLPAQNALLKTLEEPAPNTHFFLVVSYVDRLLPTLRSRMQVLTLKPGEGEVSAKKFLDLPKDKRITFASKFALSGESLGPFIDGMLEELRRRHAREELIKRVFTVRRFADDEAASPRLILEHIALVLD
ncbi:MAG: hypothetical protein WD874_02000 [Parcubacteria group bacterium]